MPNWCYVKITANPKVLADMIDDEGAATFQKLLPLPEELKGTTSPTPKDADEKEIEYLLNKYGSSNWYDWSRANWGVKWDASTDILYDGGNFVAFRTAWCPPQEFISTLSQKHPEEIIEVEWEEEQGFGEEYSIKNGKIEIIEQWPMPEFGEFYGIANYAIYKCDKTGGRLERGLDKWHRGKYYIDMDADQEYDTLEEAKQAVESFADQ